jgi:hypothetical protein
MTLSASGFRLPASAFCLLLSGVAASSLAAQQQGTPRVPPSDRQIAAAVLPLPAAHRAVATVLGYDARGALVRLRAGTGIFTCLADDPRDDQFHVACYHNSLEPFMARGRQLRAQGVQGDAVDSTRSADVAAGRIRMPAMASLYSLTGPGASVDPATGAGARPLFVVYVPGATEASTGVSTTPRAGAPWLMDPGTPKAHIMFQPGMGR